MFLRLNFGWSFSRSIRVRNLHQRETLFRYGDRVEHVYFIAEGELLLNGKPKDIAGQMVQTLRATFGIGSLVGQYDLLFRNAYSTRARALKPTTVIEIDAKAILYLVGRHPWLRDRLVPSKMIGRLRAIPILSQFDLIEICFIAEKCERLEFAPHSILYRAGDTADRVYLIDQGQVRIDGSDRSSIWLGNGAALGFPESGQQRRLSEKVAGEASTEFTTYLFRINKKELVDIVGIELSELAARNLIFRRRIDQVLHTLPLFSDLTSRQRRQLAGYLSHEFFPAQRELLKQGTTSPDLLILMPGSHATVTSADDAGLPPSTTVDGPAMFNERSLLEAAPLEANVSAEGSSFWLRLNSTDLRVYAQLDRGNLLRQVSAYLGRGNLIRRVYLCLKRGHLARRIYAYLRRSNLIGQTSAYLRRGNLIGHLKLPRPVRREPLRARLFRVQPDLREDEVFIGLYKRHWLTLLPKIVPSFILFLFLLPVLIGAILLEKFWEWGVWAVLLVGLPLTLLFLWNLLSFLGDYLLVTTQRIMRQTFVPFTYNMRKIALLEQVQNIDVLVPLAGKMLGYGDITIQTASTEGTISLDFVVKPSLIRKTVFEQKTRRQQFFRANNRAIIRESLESTQSVNVEVHQRVVTDDLNEIRLGPWANLTRRINKRFSRKSRQGWASMSRIVWRKHWYVLLRQLLLPLVMLIPILVVIVAVPLSALEVNTEGNGEIMGWLLSIVTRFGAAIVLPAVFFGLLLFTVIAWIVADWRNDTYEIDDSQIIDTEKLPMGFMEHRRTAQLGQIQDIQLEISSPLYMLLNVGNVKIQTAASDGVFTFDWVGRPRQVADEIRRRIDSNKERQEENRATQRAKEIQDWIDMAGEIDTKSFHQ